MKFIFYLLSLFVLIVNQEILTGEESPVEFIIKGDKYLISGDIEKSREIFQKVFSKFPTWWVANIRMAIISRIMLNPSEQIKEYIKRSAEFSKDQPIIWFFKGVFHEEDEELKLAEKSYLKAKSLWGGGEKVSLALGRVYAEMGLLSKSEMEYIEIIKRYPLCKIARWKLYEIYIARGEFDKGIEMLKELKALNGNEGRIEEEIKKVMRKK